jgi:oligoribonuclease NrnB/cAMP/cGMP phosphodiesterase (DHH superfamily)
VEASRAVHIVSHGPGCLDGLVSAVVLSHYFADNDVSVGFEAPRDIDAALREFSPPDPQNYDLWVTDISWKDPATDAHLARLVARGLRLYWMDHHKSAADRIAETPLGVAPTDSVLDLNRAASLIVWDYLAERAPVDSDRGEALKELHPLVLTADDVDRWILKIPGSRELALAMSAMRQDQAFDALMEVDSKLAWPKPIRRAMERVRGKIAKSLELAVETRTTSTVANGGVTVVAAECWGFAGEISDRWKQDFNQAVFALFDHRADAISLRRTDDCQVDLSQLAASFGGGGHAAAAGFEIDPAVGSKASELARLVARRLDEGAAQ